MAPRACVVLLERGWTLEAPSPVVLGPNGRPATPTTGTLVPVTTAEKTAGKEINVVVLPVLPHR